METKYNNWREKVCANIKVKWSQLQSTYLPQLKQKSSTAQARYVKIKEHWYPESRNPFPHEVACTDHQGALRYLWKNIIQTVTKSTWNKQILINSIYN